jgi:2-polyprenyl-6-hydroxyphenyl methylase / 3-demethylubiquinone-9 3-methyltransferase
MSLDNFSINDEEVAKFSAMSDKWWDLNGPLKTLHEINSVRVEYIKNRIITHFNSKKWKEIKILDVGCGGGIVSESFAKLGANVTGIDASESNIKVAKNHAQSQGLSINYNYNTAENFAKTAKKFDAILCLEIIEHVEHVPLFIKSCCQMLKPNGLIFFATINRTIKSYAFAILGAEYILRWLPIGTHSWHKFVRPSEISSSLRVNNCKTLDISGLKYQPLSNNRWFFSEDKSVNYILVANKV